MEHSLFRGRPRAISLKQYRTVLYLLLSHPSANLSVSQSFSLPFGKCDQLLSSAFFSLSSSYTALVTSAFEFAQSLYTSSAIAPLISPVVVAIRCADSPFSPAGFFPRYDKFLRLIRPRPRSCLTTYERDINLFVRSISLARARGTASSRPPRAIYSGWYHIPVKSLR